MNNELVEKCRELVEAKDRYFDDDAANYPDDVLRIADEIDEILERTTGAK